MKEKLKAINNLIYYMAGSYLEYFLGLLISIIIARSITPSEYGVYSFLVWLSSLGVIFINNGINTAVIKFLAEERGKEGSVDAVFTHLRRIQLDFAIVVSLMIVVVGVFWSDKLGVGNGVWILILLVTSIFFRSTYMFYSSVAKGMEQFRVIAISVLMVSPLNLLMVFLAGTAFASIEGFIVVYTIVSILYCLAVVFLLKGTFDNKASDELDPVLRKRISAFIKVVSVNVILGFIIYKQSELAFLKLFATSEDVAFYNVGFILASSSMLLVPGIFSGLLLPLMSKAGVQKDGGVPRKFLSSTRYLIFLSLPVAVIGVILSQDIIVLLYGEEYTPSSIVMSVCLVSSGIAVSSHAAVSYFISSDNQRYIMKLFMIVALLNIALDTVLIKMFGLAGAYWANLTASLILSGFLIDECRKALDVRLEYSSYLKLLFVSLVAAIPLWLSVSLTADMVLLLLSLFIYAPAYIVGSIVLRCWSKEDYRLFGFMTRKVAPSSFLVNYFEKMSVT